MVALIRALTPAQVAAAVIRHGLPLVGADAGALLLISRDTQRIRTVGAAGYGDGRSAGGEEYALDAEYPVCACIRNRESVWLSSRDERTRRFPQLEADDPDAGRHAWVAIPLLVGDRPIGALSLSFTEARRWSADERTLMNLLAQQCSQALERARLYEAERRARVVAEFAERRVTFLAEASARLGASLDYRSTLRSVAELIVPEFADWVVIRVVAGDGERSALAVLHRDPALSARLQAFEQANSPAAGDAGCAAAALFEGRAELLSEVPSDLVAREAKDPENAALLEALDTRSRICVPIRARNRVIGVLVVGATAGGRRYTATDLALAEDIAVRIGQAVDNAHLYENALHASEAKSDFLAVMSHELRTPLNAILGYADLILLGVPEPVAEPTRHQVERIQVAGGRLLRMVDEVLSFARLEAGREVVHAEPTLLLEVLQDSLALVEPLAGAKGLAVALEAETPGLVIHTDGWKLRHILSNLLSNAVKFTDRGRVDLSARVRDAWLEIEVRDTGIGIPAEHLERIFEPFWQVDRSATRRFEGTGLGLGVAREMARLLGGDISVASRLGEGSAFTVALPVGRRGA